ncbi:helix-turn-helix domain-containing protein [Clostridium cellulovorans]|uniref:Helix-turn-helix domain protein n=1 Tax=Clostridium cellulovorans (strain ATCC 35296 / DSM 3052 / OCM 3 / 743B) TaxID=573061 RepID=D9SP45_CLOC7|nr:helix-turn-helix transcriptional regulator [Clostridium cellulovorans]ADL52010.1 helix-turn-helix domain protein [Clostridium cellulovorans 743B]
MNKTTTFREVFETVETGSFAAYKDLPENTLAEKIIKLRMLNGLTQRQFAARCGIGYSSLCRYEVGGVINSDNLEKIIGALNLDVHYFD